MGANQLNKTQPHFLKKQQRNYCQYVDMLTPQKQLFSWILTHPILLQSQHVCLSKGEQIFTVYRCNKHISVFAPGTLGILPDTYLVLVSYGLLGDIVSMYQNMDIKYLNNLQYMGLGGFINVTEEPLDDIKHSIYSH